MRTFHTGGVAGSDITQGLPRVEEIFEARRPKKAAELAEIDGIVRIEEGKRSKQITIVNNEDGTAATVAIPGAARILVKDGDKVVKCQKLTEGTETPADILRISGLDAVYEYIIKEIQLLVILVPDGKICRRWLEEREPVGKRHSDMLWWKE
jgi:DNA-directed RNA polymerase subunit beta'